ncbi:ROK family protein [Buchananella felis]|uniref:ROK family protein n=1 Tax=Buchananella felis TaxID=3231492 RepID=UPI0035297D72
MTHAIGIDVGGTTIKAGVASVNGELLARRQVPTPKNVPDLISTISTLAAELRADVHAGKVYEGDRPLSPAELVKPIGVAVPGIVDEANGMALLSANLGWRDVPMRQMLEEACGVPVAFGHDVRSGAVAEARWGAGSRDMLFVALGTGIGAGVVLHGEPVIGSGYAGEIGQILVRDPDNPSGWIELEKIAAASAVCARFAATMPEAEREAVIAAGAYGVEMAAKGGNEDAQRVMREAVDALAEILATIVGTLGSLRIVIGGGLANAGEFLLAPLRQALAERLVIAPVPEVVKAELGSWAQCLGRARTALELAGYGEPVYGPDGKIIQED